MPDWASICDTAAGNWPHIGGFLPHGGTLMMLPQNVANARSSKCSWSGITLVFWCAQCRSHSDASPSCDCSPLHTQYPPRHPWDVKGKQRFQFLEECKLRTLTIRQMVPPSICPAGNGVITSPCPFPFSWTDWLYFSWVIFSKLASTSSRVKRSNSSMLCRAYKS